MKSIKKLYWILFILCGFSTGDLYGQFIDKSGDRVKTPLEVSFKPLGTIKPRSTKEIEASRITIGGETLDRDFAIFDEYKVYLPLLGVKKIRLQAGWAKTEKKKGEYDWKWLDEIINFAVANDIEPWLETSYGNPIYEGGGGTGLLNSLMTSEEGYAAWDRWVEALANRYKDRVKEWEIWNEPDHPMQEINPETIAALNIRTAEIIKKAQPDAKIAGLAFASHTDTVYLDRFLKYIADRDKLPLFHWISYHSYNYRPEGSYPGVMSLKRVLNRYSPDLLLRQGENGAPSNYIPSFALDKYYWTEYSQAKYNLRRILGDLGRDIETSIFTIIDLNYRGSNPVLNMKGIIQSDTSGIAIRPKVAYYSLQNAAAIFDNSLEVNKAFSFTGPAAKSLSVFGFQQKNTKKQLVAIWEDAKIPGNRFKTESVDVVLRNVAFKNPVWIDLLTGKVYEIPKDKWTRQGDTMRFTIPVYDSPVLIVEKSLVRYQ